ncbi:MAG: hypothetical protein RI894_76 [Bacteroidota bacterium]|jgi:outer membrane cobalamin receptor
MKRIYFILNLLLLMTTAAFSQKFTVSGRITESENKEGVPMATVIAGTEGIASDFEGNYAIDLPNGIYQLVFSYVGYENLTKEVTVKGAPIKLDVEMSGVKVLDVVNVTADIARERETPVAFANIPTIKLKEELASQDIPMILNSTPGIYATQGGGGVGDARVSVRGFSQRNVAVMLDGVPVNDMENGQVFWSNWFGLENMTKTMQVQRGLGASKLAVPSIGGSINILTKGIDDKASFVLNEEIGTGGYLRNTISVNSGHLKGGWGISSAVSYQRADGFVGHAYSKGFFYYLRIDKQFGKKHTLSLSGFGAPQEHGQNNFRGNVANVDANLASELYQNPVDKTTAWDLGTKFNPNWGTDPRNGNIINTRVNYYHKPQFTLRYSWQISPKVFLANIAYLSMGSGGGTGISYSPDRTTDKSQVDFSGLKGIAAYYQGQPKIIDNVYTSALPLLTGQSDKFLNARRNDHFWYGLLSTVRYDINNKFVFSGGVDLRDYQGHHFRTPYDLLGGQFYNAAELPLVGTFTPKSGSRDPRTVQKVRVGDVYEYDNTGYVRWGGAFGMLEYKKDKISAFVNVSGSYTGYKLVDWLKPKVLNINDKRYYLGAFEKIAIGTDPAMTKSVTIDGNTYNMNSPEVQYQTIDWTWIPGYTFKAGGAYNLSKEHSVFANVGWISKAQRFNNVIRQNTPGGVTTPFTPIQKVENAANEDIKAVELGYSFRNKIFAANINAYYTSWKNKPLDNPPTETDPITREYYPINVNGIGALHKGIEFDASYKPNKQLTIEGLASVGDWRWTEKAEYFSILYNKTIVFDPTGVPVGDAAQTQLGATVRWEPIKDLYFKARATYFANNYSNFSPENLKDANERRESWKMPNYTLLDAYMGYTFHIDKKVKTSVRLNCLNALDTVYISDAQSGADFNADSSTVLFGTPRRFVASFTLEF